MSAYLTYVISGTNSRNKKVSIEVKALTIPPPEVATWLLHERYPSARGISVSIPAAHNYPKKAPTPIIQELSTTPVRRRRAG